MTESIDVGILGLGYMGLATGVAFAQRGHRVFGFDIVQPKRASIERGELPIYEPGLGDALRGGLRSGRFQVVHSLEELIARSRVIFLCLPTPSGADGAIDLRILRSAVADLARHLRGASGHRLIVVKSTVVPGTVDSVVGPDLRQGSGLGVDQLGVASNPEFLAEGTMMQDAMAPARVVIGVSDPASEKLLQSLYASFPTEVVVLPPAGAELVKYTSNSFLALKVTFANEIARLCDRVGVNVDLVMQALGKDPRVGAKFLVAGPGFGGSCFDKDVRALADWAKNAGQPLRIPQATLQANDDQVEYVLDLVARAAGPLDGRTVALLGLSFKAGTDDVRLSRAFPVALGLARRGAHVRAHDPVAADKFAQEWASYAGDSSSRLAIVPEVLSALRGAHVAVLQTDWPEYSSWPAGWTSAMAQPILVDLRRAIPPGKRTAAGLHWFGLGDWDGGAPAATPPPQPRARRAAARKKPPHASSGRRSR